MTETLERGTAHFGTRDEPAPIGFGRLLGVEWRKGTDTRAARWLIAIAGFVTLATLLLPLLLPNDMEQSVPGYLEIASTGALILLPIVAILTLTSEWTQRTVLSTFTQEPRRARVVWAKVVVSMLLGLLGAVWAFAATYGFLAVSSAMGRDVSFELPGEVALGFPLALVLSTLTGAALGALLHHTAFAIVLSFVIPTVVSLVATIPAIETVGAWLNPTANLGALATGDYAGRTAEIGVTVAVWVVVPLVAGFIRTVRREVR